MPEAGPRALAMVRRAGHGGRSTPTAWRRRRVVAGRIHVLPGTAAPAVLPLPMLPRLITMVLVVLVFPIPIPVIPVVLVVVWRPTPSAAAAATRDAHGPVGEVGGQASTPAAPGPAAAALLLRPAASTGLARAGHRSLLGRGDLHPTCNGKNKSMNFTGALFSTLSNALSSWWPAHCSALRSE